MLVIVFLGKPTERVGLGLRASRCKCMELRLPAEYFYDDLFARDGNSWFLAYFEFNVSKARPSGLVTTIGVGVAVLVSLLFCVLDA